MAHKLFKIEYTQPDTEELVSVLKTFEDTESGITAREWAEDWAYSVADKGHYTVTEIVPPHITLEGNSIKWQSE